MFRRNPDRAEYEEDIYERDRYSRHGDRLDRQYHFEEEFEDHPRHRAPKRPRELVKEINETGHSGPAFMKEHSRGASVGPVAIRPRRLSDDYVHIPREIEREREDFRGLHPRRERISPPEDVIIQDKYSRHTRGKGRDYERELDVDIERGLERGLERGRRRSEDDIYVNSLSRRSKSRPRMAEREELFVHRNGSPGRRGIERDEAILRREIDGPSVSDVDLPLHAPSIHQDVVTHHRHLDHGEGYTAAPPRHRTIERPMRTDYKEVDIGRRRDRESQDFVSTGLRDLDLIDQRDQGRRRDPGVMAVREREIIRDPRDIDDTRVETNYYNRHPTDRALRDEAYHGAVDDWGIVDVPPGTKRVAMDGVGSTSLEISRRKYNGVRRSNFDAERDECEPYREPGGGRGSIGRSYVGIKDKRDDLWTEITKDLVVKEAIEKMGYDYEETAHFFYVFAYLQYDDVAELVDFSKEFRYQRRDRIKEIQRERARIVPLPSY